MKAEVGTDIEKAAEILEKGGLVAIPTETVYGLAANALDPDAVLKIFEAKNRPSFDPLIIHISNFEQLNDLAQSFPLEAKELMHEFWPGPLTVVMPKKIIVPDLVTSGLGSVGIRMPAHPLALKLLSLLPFPLAAPSANPFGYISPTTAQHVADQLGNKVDYILDGGPSKVGVESTIVSFESEVPRILRWGGLDLEQIEPFLENFESSQQSSDNPVAPGMLSSHYAPRKRLILGNLDELIEIHGKKDSSYLSFRKSYDMPGETLSESGDLSEAARNLFAAMRRLDAAEGNCILAERVPEKGLGRAINDRLKRAAHQV
ncbi:MAG TPA: L-threonylcarbamoyladenylate synthase [Cryomorphaceae bacterium]|nr:L-threonylcarbamoyladenylate synthase [Cryomorphaceae bacterium]